MRTHPSLDKEPHRTWREAVNRRGSAEPTSGPGEGGGASSPAGPVVVRSGGGTAFPAFGGARVPLRCLRGRGVSGDREMTGAPDVPAAE